MQSANRVIDYQYDGLYRLTQANYTDNGAWARRYNYAYDLIGNRTGQTLRQPGHADTQITYTYNIANSTNPASASRRADR